MDQLRRENARLKAIEANKELQIQIQKEFKKKVIKKGCEKLLSTIYHQ